MPPEIARHGRRASGILAAWVLALFPWTAGRADISVSASLEPDETEVGRMVQYQVTVSAERRRLPPPQLPDLPDVEVVSRGTSQSVSVVNGQVSYSVAYLFGLVPRREGIIEIPPARIFVDGQVFETEPLRLKVHPPGRGPPPPSVQEPEDPFDRLFFDPFRPRRKPELHAVLLLVPDKTSVYVGEPLTLSWKLLVAAESDVALQTLEPLRLEGFWTEEPRPVPNPRPEGRKTRDGVPHLVYTVQRQVVVPMSAGTKSIPPAKAVLVVDTLFHRLRRDLTSAPLTVEVRPLPAGAPPEFRNAVGSYAMEAELDKPGVRLDEAFVVRVTVRGRGHLKGLEEPLRPDLPDLRIFKATSALRLDERDPVSGSKVFEYVMVPRRTGKVTIPPFVLCHFDPGRKEYRILRTVPLTVEVEPGASPVGEPPAEAGGDAASYHDGLRPPRHVAPSVGHRLLHRTPWPWAVLAWDLLAVAIAAVLSARRRERGGAPYRAYAVFLSLRQKSLDLLREGRVDEAASLLGRAFENYLAERLGIPKSELTRQTVSARLPATCLADYQRTADALDALKYAPGGIDPHRLEGLADTVRALAENLEKSLGGVP